MVLMFLFLLDNFPAVGENGREIKWGKGREEKLQDMSHLIALSTKLR